MREITCHRSPESICWCCTQNINNPRRGWRIHGSLKTTSRATPDPGRRRRAVPEIPSGIKPVDIPRWSQAESRSSPQGFCLDCHGLSFPLIVRFHLESTCSTSRGSNEMVRSCYQAETARIIDSDDFVFIEEGYFDQKTARRPNG